MVHGSISEQIACDDRLQDRAPTLQATVDAAKTVTDTAWDALERAIGDEQAQDSLASAAFTEYQSARSTWQALKASCSGDDASCRTELLASFNDYTLKGTLYSYAAEDLAKATAACDAAQVVFDGAKAALEAAKTAQVTELARLQRSVSQAMALEQAGSCNYQYVMSRCAAKTDAAIDAVDAGMTEALVATEAGESHLAFLLTALTTYSGIVATAPPSAGTE